jgi:DNA-directed RNA polymerase specialized sigma24 family protein
VVKVVATADRSEPAAPDALVRIEALALSDFYRSSFDEMVRLAFLLTGSKEIARDIVQDCFVRLHVRWSSIEQPRAYLQRSVVNACSSPSGRPSRTRSAPTS